VRKRLFVLAPVVAALSLLSVPIEAQTTHVITTSAVSFLPDDITIQPGDTVMWTNLAAGNHNVAETDCPAGPSSAYNGGIYSGFAGAVDTFSVTFTAAGQFCYVCEPHAPAGMIGTVRVIAAPAAPAMGAWPLALMGALLLVLGSVGVHHRRKTVA